MNHFVLWYHQSNPVNPLWYCMYVYKKNHPKLASQVLSINNIANKCSTVIAYWWFTEKGWFSNHQPKSSMNLCLAIESLIHTFHNLWGQGHHSWDCLGETTILTLVLNHSLFNTKCIGDYCGSVERLHTKQRFLQKRWPSIIEAVWCLIEKRGVAKAAKWLL